MPRGANCGWPRSCAAGQQITWTKQSRPLLERLQPSQSTAMAACILMCLRAATAMASVVTSCTCNTQER